MKLLVEKATRQDIRDHNSRLVLRMIYDTSEISRASLARLTQLTRTTVSEVVGGLIEQGLVEETGQGAPAIGRTPTLLRVVDDSRQVIAVSINGDELRGALVNLRGVIQHRASVPLEGRDGAEVLKGLPILIDDLVQSATSLLLGIGVSTPGLVDAPSGTVVRAINLDWRNLPLRAQLEARYQWPVRVARDSHTIALTEYLFGQSENLNNLVAIKVGVGVGAGILLNGQLFSGDGYGAGEIGHMVVMENGEPCKCGNTGCLETVASTRAIIRRAQAVAEADPRSMLHRFAAGGPLTIETVIQAFQAGDPAVQRIIAHVGRYLGIITANFVAILNIRRVVITGRVAPFGAALRDAVVHEVGQRVLPALAETTEIAVIDQGHDAELLGAAALLLTGELGLGRIVRRQTRELTA